MTRQSHTVDDEPRHLYELHDPRAELDLTSSPWNLSEGQVSLAVGRDILTPGIFQPEGGRKPLGITYAEPFTGSVTYAKGEEFLGNCTIRIAGLFLTNIYSTDNASNATRLTRIKNPETGGSPGAWPAEVVGQEIVFHGDNRSISASSTKRVKITSRSTIGFTDDTINWTAQTPGVDINPGTKFYIVYPKLIDLRGIWLTNGARFFLVRDGTGNIYLDISDITTGGDKWHLARIHNHLLLAVCPKFAPRIIRLDSPNLGTTGVFSNDSQLAGLIPPIRPPSLEIPGITTPPTIEMGVDSTAGGLLELNRNYRVKVRAVNLEDNAESEFVQARSASGVDYVTTGSIAPNSLLVKIVPYAFRVPPTHRRWTHLELWRTTAGGTIYYLENRVEIARYGGPEWYNLGENAPNTYLGSGPTSYLLQMSDATLTALPILVPEDLTAGGLPPVCRRVVSLKGITVCGGRATVAYSPSFAGSFDQRDFHTLQGKYTDSTKLFTVNGTNLFTNLTVAVSDSLVVTFGGTGGTAVGTYTILSKVNANTLELTSSAGADTTDFTCHAYIKRAVGVPYPFIQSDEDIWYSRTDILAPESFPKRTLRLSNIGDTFRTLVVVGNYAVVIMDRGVHLLFLRLRNTLSGASIYDLDKDTVSTDGEGTPWEDSVVVWKDRVFWASSEGPRMLAVSNEPGDTGRRGQIELLAKDHIHQWFRDAFDNGYTIDSGIDLLNQCIRWRRKESSNVYQVCQFSVLTGLWTLLDDDNGVFYTLSSRADASSPAAPLLYSVTEAAEVFQVNHRTAVHPYDGKTVQEVTGVTWTITTTSLTKTGVFAGIMKGDVVRFRSGNAAVNGISRVIRTASVNSITFDAVSGLASGDEFIIGAVRFRMKWAPLSGDKKSSTVTLESLRINALPGPRCGSGSFPNPPTSTFQAKIYEDYSTTPVTQPAAATVGIFATSTAAKQTEDRMIPVVGQGNALELEIECLDARTDFRLEQIQATIKEELEEIVDASTAS